MATRNGRAANTVPNMGASKVYPTAADHQYLPDCTLCRYLSLFSCSLSSRTRSSSSIMRYLLSKKLPSRARCCPLIWNTARCVCGKHRLSPQMVDAGLVYLANPVVRQVYSKYYPIAVLTNNGYLIAEHPWDAGTKGSSNEKQRIDSDRSTTARCSFTKKTARVNCQPHLYR